MNPKILMQESKEYADEVLRERRHIHSLAETGFDLKQTVLYVKSELENMGVEPKPCGKSGLTAVIGDENKGGVFLIRADMDALPIKEESGLDFAADNGNMHACGHDMHTAMLLGAARLLKMHESELCGAVKLMFQPAEEIFEGSKDMIGAGVLKNPDVDAALMIHVMASMPIKSATVIVSPPGVSAPAADYFEITVFGKGCHGSMPNCGVDPIVVSAHIITALEEIQTRELACDERATVTFGTVNGGTAANIIPDSVVMRGSIRTFDEETRAYIKKRICEVSEAIAAAFRARAQVEFGSGCPTLKNDRSLSLSAEKFCMELLGEESVLSASKLAQTGGRNSKSAGSEDFAYVSQQVPTIMLALAAGRPEDGYEYPQHHPMTRFDESVLSVGSAVYAYNAARMLEESLIKVHDEHKI